MPKGINLLRMGTISEEEKHKEVEKFLHFVQLTIGYAPDREGFNLYDLNSLNDPTFSDIAQNIMPAIEENFFKDLYIDRPEREIIEGEIPAKRLILIYGLSGVGKTILVRKIFEEYSKKNSYLCVYLDFNKIRKQYLFGDGIEDRFEEYIYHDLYSKFIGDFPDKLNEWISFKIINDPVYSEVKETILDIYQKPLNNLDWLPLLKEPIVLAKKAEIKDITSLEYLLKYLLNDKSLVFFFDNVDKFPFEIQSKILSDCIEISNSSSASIILTIRTSNIKRILAEGANGDFLFIENIKKVTSRQISPLKKKSSVKEDDVKYDVKQLIYKRLDFIRRNQSFKEFGKYFNQINQTYEWGHSPDSYIKSFMDILIKVNDSIINNDILNFCNYNVRELLIMYFGFISKLLLEPETTMTIKEIFPDISHTNNTKLRNYFYKWLICSGELIPTDKMIFPNIFQIDTGYSLLIIKVLSYLYNNQAGENAIKYEEMKKNFWSFGIDEITLRTTLEHLAENQEFNGKCMIWIDRKNEKEIGNSNLILMPAGIFFLEKFSISRDYIFWMALITELPTEYFDKVFTMKSIDYLKTYDDEFRTRIVISYIRNKILIQLENEFNWFNKSLNSSTNSFGSWKESYFSLFTINNELYQSRLIDSILKSIYYIDIAEPIKAELQAECSELRKIIEEQIVNI